MDLPTPSIESLLLGFPAPLARVSRTGEIVTTTDAWTALFGTSALVDRVVLAEREVFAAAFAGVGTRAVDVQIETNLWGERTRFSFWPADEHSSWVLAEAHRDVEQERKTRILVDCFRAMDANVWSCNLEGKILVSDGLGLKHLGLVPGQMVGLNIFEIFPADSPAIDTVKRTFAGETFVYEDVTEQAHWLNFYTPLLNAKNEVLGLESISLNLGKDMRLAKRAKAIADCVDKLPIMVWAIDKTGICTVLSGNLANSLGLSAEDLVGKNLFEVWQDRPDIVRDFQRALEGEHNVAEYAFGDYFTRSRYAPLRGPFGEIIGACAAMQDATTQRRDEQQLRDQLVLIESQKRAIAELGTPIIEVWQDVLAVPIVGSIDQTRAEQMLAELLDMIVSRQARFAILDVTGVDTVDTVTAQHLVRVIEASKLLGCEGVITGIRPSVANTLVELGTDLSQIRTLRSLKDALRFCAGRSVRA